MALLGSVAAQGYTNSSTPAVSTTSSAAGATYTDGAEPTVGGVKFLIETDTLYQGTVLTLSRKRQSNGDIGSCLSTCAASTECVGTAFVSDTMSCIYYSSVDLGTAADTPGTDFALVQSRATASSTSSVFNGTASVTDSPTAGQTTGAMASSTGGMGSGNSTRPTGGMASSMASSSNYANSTRATGSATGGVPASRTSSGSASSTPSSAPVDTPSSLITINGVLFFLEVNITYSGITIDFEILAKRAGYTLDQCLTTCANNVACAGTAYDNGMCTFYSSIDSGSRRVDVGNTFGTVVSRPASVNGTSPASNVTAESLICPAYNGAVITSNVDSIAFSVDCGQFLIGTTFDIDVVSKRQSTGLPTSLSNCVDRCALSDACVGTTFDIARSQCSYYSSVAYSTAVAGFDSAVRVEANGVAPGQTVTTTTVNAAGQTVTTTVIAAGPTTTVFAAAPTTATVYAVSVSTVTVYAGGSTAYPSGAVVTTVVPVGTTTYTNYVSTATNMAMPTVTVYAANAAAAAAAPTSTVTVYAGSGSSSPVTVTVDAAGNIIGSSGATAGAAYPTVTVHDTVTYCPAQETTWTTIYV